MTLPLVPVPTRLQWHQGAPVSLDQSVKVRAPHHLAPAIAGMLGIAEQHIITTDGAWASGQDQPSCAVVLSETTGDGEGYALRAGDGVVALTGSRMGLLRGLATVVQLRDLAAPGAPAGQVPAVHIEDEPRLAVRGLMIDVARHFFGVASIKRVLDLMAAYKFNVLHLHLSDDQGWRIEVPSRPELTERSGGTEVGGGPGGFFTVADYQEIVEHAAVRGIEVVPEIDMPGHVNAAQHAIGALNDSGEPAEPYTGIEVGFSKLSLANPATAAFIDEVLAHLAAITPGEYLHVGGDEVHQMPREEYREFARHLALAARRAGKKPQLWGEAAVAELPAGTRVQLWDSNADHAPVVAAARAGAGVVLSPGDRVYLDMKYHQGYELGLDWAGYVQVRDSYDWDPAQYAEGLPPEAIEGVEAALWTETLSREEHLFTMLLPRLVAVAEVGWSAQEQREWEDFASRARAHAPLWEDGGYAYHRSTQVF